MLLFSALVPLGSGHPGAEVPFASAVPQPEQDWTLQSLSSLTQIPTHLYSLGPLAFPSWVTDLREAKSP